MAELGEGQICERCGNDIDSDDEDAELVYGALWCGPCVREDPESPANKEEER